MFNYNLNNLDLNQLNIKILNSHNKIIDFNLNKNPYSRICNYSKNCNYKCFDNKSSNSDQKPLDKTIIDNKDEINLYNYKELIETYKNKIIKPVIKNLLISLDTIKKEINIDKEHTNIFELAVLSNQ